MEDPPEVDELEEVLQPKQIVFHKDRKLKGGQLQRKFLVKFKNYSPLDAKWMEKSDLVDYPQLVLAYEDAFQLRTTED